KSTFLRCFNRMHDLYPGNRYEGEIVLQPDNTNLLASGVDPIEVRMRIGMVFQKPNPFPKSVYENVAYGLRVRGESSRRRIDEKVEQALQDAALWNEVKERLHQPAYNLSGGQQQRLCASHGPGAAAVRRAHLGARPDRHRLDRGADARPEGARDHPHRDAQHAAGGARVGLHRLHVPRRSDRVRRDGRAVHQAEDEADRRLHHRQIRLTDHASKQYDLDLGSIRSRVLAMGGLVEAQIRRATDALISGNLRLSDEVIEADHRVNAMEVEIDGDCSQLIVRRQPAAGDLRMIFAIMKTVTDLERIGDEAQKIARMAKNINERGGTQAPPLVEVRHAAEAAISMLRRTLDCFARLDCEGAAEVIRDDAGIDTEFRSILRQ